MVAATIMRVQEPHARIIIAGVDGSGGAADGLAVATALGDALDATALAVYVHPYGQLKSVLSDSDYGDVVRELADTVHAEMRGLGIAMEERRMRIVDDGSAPRGLARTAERTDALLIALGGSRRTRVGRVFPGGTGERLLAGAPCPVAIAPRGYATHERTIATVACGFDGSTESSAALEWAGLLAGSAGAKLRIIVVHEPLGAVDAAVLQGVPVAEVDAARRTDLGRELAAAERPLRDDGVQVEGTLAEGDPAHVLEEQSATADLLVVGSRGYGPASAVLLGSVSNALVRNARCPVVVVPRREEGDAPTPPRQQSATGSP